MRLFVCAFSHLVFVASLAGAAFGQSFNIDIGTPSDGQPNFGFGAATGQTGWWTLVDVAGSNTGLLDLTGNYSNATITWPVGAISDSWPELAGNHGKLFNDFQMLGPGWGTSANWSIQGLQNGPYRVTFYSRPISGQSMGSQPLVGESSFTLAGGALGLQVCDGTLVEGFHGYRYGVHFVQDTTTVTNGTLSWTFAFAGGLIANFNAMQIEALSPGSVQTYCTAKTNSLGCVPAIASSGTPSVSGGSFSVIATNERSHRPGFLVWSHLQNGMPYSNGSGFLCVARPFVRTALQDSAGTPAVDDCSGAYSFPFDSNYLALAGLTAGDVVNCQYWSLDENAPGGNALTRGLSFVLAP